MKARKKKSTNPLEQFVFRASHFYQLLEKQDYKCALSGRELRPENTRATHATPLRKDGGHTLENIILVDDDVDLLKKNKSVREAVDIAADIIATAGKQYGYELKRRRPQ